MKGQFGVHGVEHEGELTIIIGRCYLGRLRLGDAFVRNTLPEGTVVTTRLTISQMEAYRHSLEEIEEGLTARITLTGDGGDTVVVGSVLDT